MSEVSKQRIITKIQQARKSHIQWFANAEALISGALLNETQVPLTYASCQFGQWYYGDGQCLANIKVFNDLEEPHKILHSCYMKIFILLFEQVEPSFLKKLFGSAQKQKINNIKQAKAMLPELERYSQKMIQLLKMLEAEIFTMTDERFNKLFCL
jgi:hypothetical protein